MPFDGVVNPRRHRDSNVTRLLIDSRDCIARYGWRKGEFGTTTVGFCLVGAVRNCACDYNSIITLQDAGTCMMEVIKNWKYGHFRVNSIPNFNDYILNSKEEALAFMDKAIEVSREHDEASPMSILEFAE